jgi:PEP-CTERM motif
MELPDGAASSNIATTHNVNYDLFVNIVTPSSSGSFWAEEACVVADCALSFRFGLGSQGGALSIGSLGYATQPYLQPGSQSNFYQAWAVHMGDAGIAPIPEPEIYAMMGIGLGLLGWVGRRRKQQAA